MEHNKLGASATQPNLAANSIQFGFGASGSAMFNEVAGNQWMGTTNWAATAVLIYAADGVTFSKNNIGGNSDIGLYIFGDGGTYDNNKVFDEGADHPNADFDIGIGNWGLSNTVTNNKVRGFDMPYDGVTGGDNKVIPGKNSSNELSVSVFAEQ